MVRFKDLASLSRARSGVGKDLRESESLKYPYPVDEALLKSNLGLWLRLETGRPEVIQKLRRQPGFVRLEPKRTAWPLYVPNDPSANITNGEQLQTLNIVRAYQAWDTTQGDTAVIIGILDTGTDFTHPDLGHVARNFRDTINGLDDDRNGLIDDYWGYDLSDLDADPHPLTTNAHGTNVASISSATTDNGVGIAGMGFRCMYRPYKVYGAQFTGFEAIVQAAQYGCRIINCSWGRNGNPSQWEQDVIDYVVQQKKAVIVAAAGNTTGQFDFFPASYSGVISVGFTTSVDVKHANSTVSPYVDLVAPGGSVFGISTTGTYANIGGGSSFAAPMVSAGAALVLSRYPGLTPRQVEALLKAYSDRVDTIAANRPFRGLLGAGRLNLVKAVSGNKKYAGEVSGLRWKDSADELLQARDTVSFNLCFASILDPLPGVQLDIKSLDTNLVILNSQFSNSDTIGDPGICTSTFPFRAVVRPRATNNRQVVIEVMARNAAVGYQQAFYLVLRLQKSYITLGTFGRAGYPEGVAFTVAGNGRLGYIDDAYTLGDGFRAAGRSYLAEGGIAFARDSVRVVSTLIGTTTHDKDLTQRGLPSTGINEAQGIHWASFSYSDSAAVAAVKIGLRVYQTSYAVQADSLRRCGFNEYKVVNTGMRRLDSLHAGYVTDWDIVLFDRNVTRFDANRKLGYTYSKTSGEACGTLFLSPSKRYGFAGIDAATGVNRNINLLDGFSRAEKFRAISGYRTKSYAGLEATIGGNTVAGHGTRLDSISAGGTARFASILIFGTDTNDLKTNALRAERFFRARHSGPAWPGPTELILCKGDTAKLMSGSSSRYAFYRAGTIPAGQGSSFSVPYLVGQDSAQVWVVNTDSVFDGNPVVVKLRWQLPQAGFILADTIDFDQLPWPVTGQAQNATTVEYQLYRNGNLLFETLGQNLNLTDSILPQPGIYRLCQIATFQPGCADTSCKNFLVNRLVGTKQTLSLKPIVIPNPAQSYILVKRLSANWGQQPILSDALGRRYPVQILERGATQILLSVADLPPGIYGIAFGSTKVTFVKAKD